MPIQSLIIHYGIPIVSLLIFANELGVPTGVPAEITLLLAGSHALHTVPGLLVGMACIAAADLLGTTTLHLAARAGGTRVLRHLRRHEDRLNGMMRRWHERLGDHESLVVFVTRLLPLVRMWAAIGTGLMRFRLRNFLLGATPAAVLWTGLPLVTGYIFRGSVQRIDERYTFLAHTAIFLLPAATVVVSLAFWVRAGAPAAARLRRLRCLVGFGGAIGGAACLATTLDTWHAWVDQAPPVTVAARDMVLLLVLVILVTALGWLAVRDLRAVAGRTRRSAVYAADQQLRERLVTLSW